MLGTATGLIKGDTRSLDYGSCQFRAESNCEEASLLKRLFLYQNLTKEYMSYLLNSCPTIGIRKPKTLRLQPETCNRQGLNLTLSLNLKLGALNPKMLSQPRSTSRLRFASLVLQLCGPCDLRASGLRV